ncbi:MAG: pyrroloquinoline quinone biosynthesis peptide chaperone PqqD [Chthoniobacteraceae bacterium]
MPHPEFATPPSARFAFKCDVLWAILDAIDATLRSRPAMSDLRPQVRPQLASHVRMKIDPLTGEPVLLFSEGLLVLNHTAHEIVRRCDGKATLAEIVRQLATEFDGR